ncbi:MAG: homoserine kinase [Sulfolobaceae archaeon]|nr:homoserine kinase [Sulfolobaceae archaeon]
MKPAKARAYSSSANLGAGYDILAVAHNAFFDEVTAIPLSEGKIDVKVIADGIPQDYQKNTAGWAVYNMLKELDLKVEVELRVKKGVPIGLGLGSSGASSAAAVTAVNEALGLNLSKLELVKFAMEGERAAAGEPHPDNVAASIMGGFVAVTSVNPIHVINILPHKDLNLKFLLFIPQIYIENKTKKAREMVPKVVDIKSHVTNSRYLASLLLGLQTGNKELIKRGLNDEIVEKSRLPLFPFYTEFKKLGLEAGAVGVCVSGAGPTILAFIDESTNVNMLMTKGVEICDAHKVKCITKIAEIANGVEIEGAN